MRRVATLLVLLGFVIVLSSPAVVTASVPTPSVPVKRTALALPSTVAPPSGSATQPKVQVKPAATPYLDEFYGPAAGPSVPASSAASAR